MATKREQRRGKLAEPITEQPITKREFIQSLIVVFRRSSKAIRALPKASERKGQLARFGAALETILENNETAELYFQGTKEFAHLKRAAKSLQPIVKLSLQQKLKRGPDRDERTPVILTLARIFEGQTTKPATITYDPTNDRYAGEFFSFVLECLKSSPGDTPLDPFKSETALGTAVRDALAKRRLEGKTE